MKNKLKAWAILIIGLGIISCTKNQDAGPIVTETRAVSDYSELEVRGAFEVLISEDFDADLEITAPNNKMQFIDAYVLGNRLIINEDDNRIQDARMVVKVSNQHINHIELLGSGLIEGDTIYGSDLKIELSGSGRVDLPLETSDLYLEVNGSGSIAVFGQSGQTESKISGSGFIDSKSVQSSKGIARIDGSGNIMIYAEDSLTARVTGSGRIQYWGNPSYLDTNIDGSGQITDMQ